MPDDKPPDDPEVLEPDAENPPAPLPAKRARRRDDDFDDDDRDDRDDDYHPRGRQAKYDEDGYEITSEHTLWAVFAHLGVLFAGFLAPLVILIVYRQKSPFVVGHARECLNHLITVLLINVLLLGIGCGIGFGVYLATQNTLAGVIVGELVAFIPSMVVAVANIVFLVLAAIAAGRGDTYRYPFTLRLIG
jgi:uncharacterized Tic20 family protein